MGIVCSLWLYIGDNVLFGASVEVVERYLPANLSCLFLLKVFIVKYASLMVIQLFLYTF